MTFFGFQLALRAADLGSRRERLADVVRAYGRATALQDMRSLWTRAAPILAECLPMAELGHWDFIRGQGEPEYESWASGLEAMAEWRASDFGDPASSEALILVTGIFLLGGDSNADRLLGDRCDIPESQWMTRETFGKLIASAPMLNLSGVSGCGLYLAPGSGLPGFSRGVLTGEGFEYLKAIVS